MANLTHSITEQEAERVIAALENDGADLRRVREIEARLRRHKDYGPFTERGRAVTAHQVNSHTHSLSGGVGHTHSLNDGGGHAHSIEPTDFWANAVDDVAFLLKLLCPSGH